MSIRIRLLIMLGCFGLMAAIVTGLGLNTMGDYSRSMAQYEAAHKNAMRASHLNYLISNVVMETRGQYIARSPEQLASFTQQLGANLDQIETLMASWQAQFTSREQVKYKSLVAETADFIKVRREVATLAKDGRLNDAEALSTQNRQARIAFQNHINTIVSNINADLAVTEAAMNNYQKTRAEQFLMSALMSILLVSALSYWFVHYTFIVPLRAVATTIIKTANGDYETNIEESTKRDELSLVWNALAVLKARAQEAERLCKLERERERQEALKLREIMLD